MAVVQPIRDEKQLQTIYEFLKNKDTRFSLIWQFCISSGLRVSDILSLRVSDVQGKESVKIRESNSNKYKVYPIRETLKNDLIEFFKEDRNSLCKPMELLFVSDKGGKMHCPEVYKVFNNTIKELGLNIKDISTHKLRKTFGYHHYKQFKDVTTLQMIFNQTSSARTIKYIGIDQEKSKNNPKSLAYPCENVKISKTKSIPMKVVTTQTTNVDNAEIIKHLINIENLLQQLINK